MPTIQAEEIVRAQWPAAAEDVAVDWETLDLEEMVRELRETAPLDMAEIDRRLAEEEVRYSDLIAALEARPPRWQKENRLTPG